MFWTITIGDIIGYLLTIIIAFIAVNKVVNKVNNTDKSRTRTTQKGNTVFGDMTGRDKNER